MIVSSVAPTGFKDFPVERVFPVIKAVGVEKVHVVRDKGNKWDARKILSALNEYQLRAHSYHSDFGEEFDLTCDDEHARRRALDKICMEAEFCANLGAEILVIHPSGHEGNISGARDNFRSMLEPLADSMEKLDIKCCIENLPKSFSYGSNTIELAADISVIGSDNLGICFDTGHSNMNGMDVCEQLRSANGLLGFIHAHDNDGKEDRHWLPFTESGTIDWNKIAQTLDKMNYKGVFCLEVFEPVSKIEQQIEKGWVDRLREFLCLAGDESYCFRSK